MSKRKTTTRVLISFIGSNDAGLMKGGEDGAVLTVFRERQFDEVHLLWNRSPKQAIGYDEIAQHVRGEIIKRGYCSKVILHEFPCKDVTDHNEIYPLLLSQLREIGPKPGSQYTAAIASGTPSMQVCWILIAESGDFPLELIRSNEPRFGRPYVRAVRLGTGLPRILRLEQEKKELVEARDALLPTMVLRISRGSLTIGDTTIPLSPVEFAYYRYFAERCVRGEEAERISGISVPRVFLQKVVTFHKESFPESDQFREPLERMLKSGHELDVRTFRGNISKLNKKIRSSVSNPAVAKMFEIGGGGKRHSRSYGLGIPPTKIRIVK